MSMKTIVNLAYLLHRIATLQGSLANFDGEFLKNFFWTQIVFGLKIVSAERQVCASMSTFPFIL